MKKMRCVKDLVGIGGAVFLAGEVCEIVSESPDYYTIQGKKRVHVLTKGGRDIKHFEFTHDTPEPKYRLLNPITGKALVDDRPKSGCADYQREVGRFIAAYGFDACATGFFDNNVDRYVAQLRPANFAWLIKKGYLERIEVEVVKIGGAYQLDENKRTYHIGQRLKLRGLLGTTDGEYIIAGAGTGYFSLINLDSGFTRNTRVKVNQIDAISQAEMDQMVSKDDFDGVIS